MNRPEKRSSVILLHNYGEAYMTRPYPTTIYTTLLTQMPKTVAKYAMNDCMAAHFEEYAPIG